MSSNSAAAGGGLGCQRGRQRPAQRHRSFGMSAVEGTAGAATGRLRLLESTPAPRRPARNDERPRCQRPCGSEPEPSPPAPSPRPLPPRTEHPSRCHRSTVSYPLGQTPRTNQEQTLIGQPSQRGTHPQDHRTEAAGARPRRRPRTGTRSAGAAVTAPARPAAGVRAPGAPAPYDGQDRGGDD